jgi:hypothetical protein
VRVGMEGKFVAHRNSVGHGVRPIQRIIKVDPKSVIFDDNSDGETCAGVSMGIGPSPGRGLKFNGVRIRPFLRSFP